MLFRGKALVGGWELKVIGGGVFVLMVVGLGVVVGGVR